LLCTHRRKVRKFQERRKTSCYIESNTEKCNIIPLNTELVAQYAIKPRKNATNSVFVAKMLVFPVFHNMAIRIFINAWILGLRPE
jgi:hypothetical protein